MKYSFIISALLFSCLFLQGQQAITFLKKHQIDVGYKIRSTPHIAQIKNNFVVIWDIREAPGPGSWYESKGAVYDKKGKLIREFDPNPFLARSFTVDQMKVVNDSQFVFTASTLYPYPNSYCYKLSADYKLVWELTGENAFRMMAKMNDSIAFGFGAKDSFGINEKYFIGKLNLNSGKYVWKKYIDSMDLKGFDSIKNKNLGSGWIIISGSNIFYSLYIHDLRLQYILKFNFDGKFLDHIKTQYYTTSFSSDVFFYLNKPLFEDSISNSSDYRKLVAYDTNSVLQAWTYQEYYPGSKIRSSLNFVSEDKYNNLEILLHRNDDLEFSNHIVKLNKKGRDIKRIKFYDPNQTKYSGFRIHSIMRTEDNGYFMTWYYSSLRYEGFIMKTDSNGYCADDSLFRIEVTDLPNRASKKTNQTHTAFPNPFTKHCTFQLPDQTNGKAHLQLFSITGNMLRKESFRGKRYELNRGNLPPGIYLYTITTKDKIYSGKVMVAE